jgi:pyruvate,orthophosphate dikinase
MTKYIYSFGGGNTEGSAALKKLLGNKGANLAEMCNLGLPVPPGFTLTTEACNHYLATQQLPNGLEEATLQSITNLETLLEKRLGDANNPLFVSVRSGAEVSMAGMMDTILNVGLNDQTVQGLARQSGNEYFAYDSYRRLIEMYFTSVLDRYDAPFEDIVIDQLDKHGVIYERDLPPEALSAILKQYKEAIPELGFPQNPHEQLFESTKAVFRSWMNREAIASRKRLNVADDLGTAASIQAMVFGNMGMDCATGIGNTRNPLNGSRRIHGNYLVNAQGTELVTGRQNGDFLTEAGKALHESDRPSFQASMPAVYSRLAGAFATLETHFGFPQEVEFTVEKNKLWLIQTRNAVLDPEAAFQIAVDMVAEGMITQAEAVARTAPLMHLTKPDVAPGVVYTALAKGQSATNGTVVGQVVFSPEKAVAIAAEQQKNGRLSPIILCREDTDPQDIAGIDVASGIVASKGGRTSHAAHCARERRIPCAVRVEGLEIDYKTASMRVGNEVIPEGDIITLICRDKTAEIVRGPLPTHIPDISEHASTLMRWAQQTKRAEFFAPANAANPA